MKLKKFRFIFVSCFMITSLLFSSAAFAQDEDLPDPGITPDSPFYFLDIFGKNIGLFLAFGPEAKAKKALEYAEERLAEARAMAAKNRAKEVERAARDYDKYLAIVAKRAGEVTRPEISDNISERVALATSKHLAVLERIKETVPEQAREAITRAKEASLNGQKNALRALAREKPERAIDINLAAIEDRLNRARVKATENITEEVEEALADADELLELEDEISEIARGQGRDIPSIEQRIAKSIANRLEVLERVHEKVPEQARQGIEKAMANSLKKYERAVEALKKKNALGAVSEETPIPERVREKIKERLESRTRTEARSSANVTEEKAAEAILEAAEELAKIQAKAEEKGVTLSADALATFNRLLSEAKSAFTAENYEEAESFAEQAEEALADVEEEIERSEKEREKPGAADLRK